jgi:biotin carboxyl carrier protein
VRYYVALDPSSAEKPALVDLVELPSGALEAHIDGRRVDLDVVPLAARGGPLSLRVNGCVVDLSTEGMPPEMIAVASGHRAHVRVQSERMRAAEQAKKATLETGDKVIKSPMPGRVVKVLVAQGDHVHPGQGVVVLEAMKMENEVRARVAGTVADVHVAAGAAVDGSTKLVTLA